MKLQLVALVFLLVAYRMFDTPGEMVYSATNLRDKFVHVVQSDLGLLMRFMVSCGKIGVAISSFLTRVVEKVRADPGLLLKIAAEFIQVFATLVFALFFFGSVYYTAFSLFLGALLLLTVAVFRLTKATCDRKIQTLNAALPNDATVRTRLQLLFWHCAWLITSETSLWTMAWNVVRYAVLLGLNGYFYLMRKLISLVIIIHMTTQMFFETAHEYARVYLEPARPPAPASAE